MLTLKYSLNSECLGKQLSHCGFHQSADVGYQTEGFSAGFEYDSEILPLLSLSWFNSVVQGSFHEQSIFRVQLWSAV